MRIALSILVALCCPSTWAAAQEPSVQGSARTSVMTLTASTLTPTVSHFERMIVLMHQSKCEATKSFQPWLHAVANLVPGIQIGQIDIGAARSIATAFKVSEKRPGPAIKLFLRDNPKGKRIVDYKGPLEFDALLDWCKAVAAGRSHSLSAYGAEPPEPSASAQPGGKASGMSKLPEGVRSMAETMVRETRLQRILTERGGGRAEHYNRLVQERFAKIVGDEETDMEDKFAVQEANRRARNEVQEELLKDAPANIRAEVRAAVNLGDMGKGNTASSGGWTGTLNKESAKKDEL